MSTLSDACLQMQQALTSIQTRCRAVSTSLTAFEDYVGLYVVTRLSRRLGILATCIFSLTASLYEQHGNQGYVCVFLGVVNGTTVEWAENEQIVANKTWYQSQGFTVLSVEEAVHLIKGMVDGLVSGEWETVLEWLNKYGKSPGLDFDKAPWPPPTNSI